MNSNTKKALSLFLSLLIGSNAFAGINSAVITENTLLLPTASGREDINDATKEVVQNAGNHGVP